MYFSSASAIIAVIIPVFLCCCSARFIPMKYASVSGRISVVVSVNPAMFCLKKKGCTASSVAEKNAVM